MGRDRSAYTKPKQDLHQQAYDRLVSMLAFGESKTEAKKTEEGIKKKIFTSESYKTYKKHIGYFIDYVKKKHPEVITLRAAKHYVNEWLEYRVNSVNQSGEPLSAWTIQTEQAALNKLYGIEPDDENRFQAPKRKRENIKRSRGTKVRDAHFSEKTNEELVNFCKGCGFRRDVLEHLRGCDLIKREQLPEIYKKSNAEKNFSLKNAAKDAMENFQEYEYFIQHLNDKNGKTRISPIVGPNTDKIVERMRNTGEKSLVWSYVNPNCDVHSYRADYATTIYKKYARPLDELDYERKVLCADGKMRSEIYVCRGDEKGKKLDRLAVHKVSIALGHNREDTAITSYIRNI